MAEPKLPAAELLISLTRLEEALKNLRAQMELMVKVMQPAEKDDEPDA